MNEYKAKIDMIGKIFGALTVIGFSHKDKFNKARWSCRCECGSEKIAEGSKLRKGEIKSCGCLTVKLISKGLTTHGMSKSKTYKIWSSMKNRCNNQRDPAYVWYGGRGIKICVRWMKFENFLADMGEHPEGMSIERKDNNGNYELENCKWATREEQGRNTSSNVFITFNSETLHVSEFARKVGMSPACLHSRLRYGWSIERALNEPVRKRQ